MKIAYLVNRYPEPTHTFIRRELRGMEALGFEVVRISIRDAMDELPDDSDREERAHTIAILRLGAFALAFDTALLAVTHPVRWCRALSQAVRLGWRSYRGVGRHLAYFVEACTVARLTRQLGVRHVHAHFGTNPAMVAMLVRTVGGPPFSVMIHGPDEFDHAEMLHLPEKVAASAFVATITDFARSQTMRWSSPDHWHKLHVIRCGVDEQFLDREPAPVPDCRRFVCVGRLGRSKGHLVLLEAVARLVDEGIDIEIVLVGDGPMREQIETSIRDGGLEQVVRLAGWMDGPGVRESIVRSRGLVLPSFGEGLPVVIMEAFAMARPVICTRIAGIRELVVPGVNGWVVNAGNTDELVIALREALDTPIARLLEMGEAGRRAVLEKHDAQAEARKLATLILRANGGDGQS